MSSDAQIAREWAAGFIKYAGNVQIVDADELTAARYILATTTAPTMADIAWDDEVHVGLCALYADGDLVRMLGPDPDEEDVIFCHFINFGSPVTGGLSAENLTPIPGTRVDLTPRREPEPESTPDHPEFLETEEDYRSAPEGTIVAQDEGKPFVLIYELWRNPNPWKGDHGDMAGLRRRVLRWGWEV